MSRLQLLSGVLEIAAEWSQLVELKVKKVLLWLNYVYTVQYSARYAKLSTVLDDYVCTFCWAVRSNWILRLSSWFKSGCREVHMCPSSWLRTSSDFNPFGMSCFASSAVTAQWLSIIIPMTEWKIAIAQKSSEYLELSLELSKAVKS